MSRPGETFVYGYCPQHDLKITDKTAWKEHLAQPHRDMRYDSLTPLGRQLQQEYPLLFRSIEEDWWGPVIIFSMFSIMILMRLMA